MNNLFLSKKILGLDLIFDKTGVLFIKNLKILVVADLHLGKSKSMNRTGNFIPPYDNQETIINLKNVIYRYKPKKIISLGDNFHDNFSILNMDRNYLNDIKKITQSLRFIWIIGNHDSNLINKEKIGGEFLRSLNEDNFNFTHIKTINKKEKIFEFSGHYHPKTCIKLNNSKFYYKCFVVGKNFCILPSFGYYTGGMDVKSTIFKEIKNEKIQLIVLGKREIIQQEFKL